MLDALFKRIAKSIPSQPLLDGVTPEDQNGQQWHGRVDDPGIASDLEEASETRSDYQPETIEQLDFGSFLEPGVPGVRRGSDWSKAHSGRKAMPPRQLQLRLEGLNEHRGRAWTASDRETQAALRAQTFDRHSFPRGVPKCPGWLSVNRIVNPLSGAEVLVTEGRTAIQPRKLATAEKLLAILYYGLEVGNFGLCDSAENLACELGCSERTVRESMKVLCERGAGDQGADVVPDE